MRRRRLLRTVTLATTGGLTALSGCNELDSSPTGGRGPATTDGPDRTESTEGQPATTPDGTVELDLFDTLVSPGDADPYRFFGSDISVSEDGTTAAVGAGGGFRSLFEDPQGAVAVFERTDDGWALTADLDAGERLELDGGVALGGDGLLVSTFAADDDGDRSVHLFERGDDGWHRELELGTDPNTDGDLVTPRALRGDTAVVRGTVAGDGDSAGDRDSASDSNPQTAMCVFEHHDDGWTQRAVLTPPDPGSTDESVGFGSSLALSGDENTLVVGADNDPEPNGTDDVEGGAGSVHVFELDDSGWSRQAKLAAADGEPGDAFGTAVALAGDTVLVGAPGRAEAESSGVYAFEREDGSWTQAAHLTGDEDTGGFGTSVAIDGETALVGAGDDAGSEGEEAGSVTVFTRTDDGWQRRTRLLPDPEESGVWFGHPTVLRGDGATAFVGAPANTAMHDSRGCVYVFE